MVSSSRSEAPTNKDLASHLSVTLAWKDRDWPPLRVMDLTAGGDCRSCQFSAFAPGHSKNTPAWPALRAVRAEPWEVAQACACPQVWEAVHRQQHLPGLCALGSSPRSCSPQRSPCPHGGAFCVHQAAVHAPTGEPSKPEPSVYVGNPVSHVYKDKRT